MEPIGEESLDELKAILAWIHNREKDKPRTILVGGWAVYCYNRYWGSTDIDLITNNRTRRSLRYYLLNERGYRSDDITSYSVNKPTKVGDVVIDIAARGHHGFEGKRETIDMRLIDKRLELANIEGIEVYIPDRTFLLIMKIKAAWDRGWRISTGRSQNMDHDVSKRIKDFSDIHALIDPEQGGKTIDIGYLGEFLSKRPFLFEVFNDMKTSKESAEKYGILPSESMINLGRLVELVKPKSSEVSSPFFDLKA